MKQVEDMTDAERAEWMREAFEFDNCAECGLDEDAHELCAGPFGLPFARCKKASADA